MTRMSRNCKPGKTDRWKKEKEKKEILIDNGGLSKKA